ncbi:MAG TPA: hypothetical protein VN924_24270 [Bryobacteraceae bacterium]|nr:hypothetical protein [Bryobacteraceae bacterium]
MLAKRIIPCLDVTGGRVVKGVNFIRLRDAGARQIPAGIWQHVRGAGSSGEVRPVRRPGFRGIAVGCTI